MSGKPRSFDYTNVPSVDITKCSCIKTPIFFLGDLFNKKINSKQTANQKKDMSNNIECPLERDNFLFEGN